MLDNAPFADRRAFTFGIALITAFALSALAQELDPAAGPKYDSSFRDAIFEDNDNWRDVDGEENKWRLETTPEPRRRKTDRMRLLEDDRSFISRRLYSGRSGRGSALSPY